MVILFDVIKNVINKIHIHHKGYRICAGGDAVKLVDTLPWQQEDGILEIVNIPSVESKTVVTLLFNILSYGSSNNL